MTRANTQKAASTRTAKTSSTTATAKTAKAVKTAAPSKTAKATAAPVRKRAPAAKAPVVAAKPAAKTVVAPRLEKEPEQKPDPKFEMKEKVKKIKLVRDSFTMPETEYAVLGDVKKACLKAGVEVKKSELLRVGVALIRQLDIARLQEVLSGLPALKTGRPKKNK